MASLAEKQAQLLRERESALASLGLAELATTVGAATAAAKDALRRGAAASKKRVKAEFDATSSALPLRRSTRCVYTRE